MRVLKWKPGG